MRRRKSLQVIASMYLNAALENFGSVFRINPKIKSSSCNFPGPALESIVNCPYRPSPVSLDAATHSRLTHLSIFLYTHSISSQVCLDPFTHSGYTPNHCHSYIFTSPSRPSPVRLHPATHSRLTHLHLFTYHQYKLTSPSRPSAVRLDPATHSRLTHICIFLYTLFISSPLYLNHVTHSICHSYIFQTLASPCRRCHPL